jgi:hypothetical protein
MKGSAAPFTVVRFHVPATDACVGSVGPSEPHPATKASAAVQTTAKILRMTSLQ